MAVGTTTSVKHNLKAQQVENESDTRWTENDHMNQTATIENEGNKNEAEVEKGGSNGAKRKSQKHQSHDSCKSCGSLANKCSCKECECQVCSSKTRGTGVQIEPAIKSATSSAVVCSGECIRAAQRAAAGGCPGCNCLAGGNPGVKCGCSICYSNQTDLKTELCRGDTKACKRGTARKCAACDCPAAGCPCTGCKCPICKSS